jgi:hypothetical protein
MQLGAELGFPGLFFLLIGFYGLCIARLWPLTFLATPVPDPWIKTLARMVIAALFGFFVSAQFVSLAGLELPYYIVLVGAGALKLTSGNVLDNPNQTTWVEHDCLPNEVMSRADAEMPLSW